MGTTATRIAALAMAAGLLTAGCGDDSSDKTGPGMLPGPGNTADAPEQPAAAAMQLDQPAQTAGAVRPIRGPGGGTLEITPTSVVYTPNAKSDQPKNGQFLTLIFTMRPIGDIPAMPTAPIDGGGWHYITPDGQALEQGNGEAFNVYVDGYNRPMTVAGASVGASESWDITPAQAGGIVQYTDGADKTYRWQVPGVDTGPQVDEVMKSLR